MIYLRNRWAKPLMAHERVRLHTSLKPGFACGLATVQIVGVDSLAVARYLWKKHRIIVTGVKHAEVEGIRVTPNVYSTLDEIDRFTEVMEIVIKKGLPKS